MNIKITILDTYNIDHLIYISEYRLNLYVLPKFIDILLALTLLIFFNF